MFSRGLHRPGPCGRDSYFAAGISTSPQRFLLRDSSGDLAVALLVSPQRFLPCGSSAGFATEILGLRRLFLFRGGDSYSATALLISRRLFLLRDRDPYLATEITTLRPRFLSRDGSSYSAPDLDIPRKLQGFTAGQLTLRQGSLELRQRNWLCGRAPEARRLFPTGFEEGELSQGSPSRLESGPARYRGRFGAGPTLLSGIFWPVQ